MSDLIAAVAEADVFDALVDVEGCIWIRMDHGWTYLADATEASWDIHARLPEAYGPYRPLDEVATAMVFKAVKTPTHPT